MRILIVLLCIFGMMHGALVAQGQSPAEPFDAEQQLRTLATLRLSALQVKNQQLDPATTPYLFEDWQEGTGFFVKEKQDTFSATVLMNIDLLRQMLAIRFRDGAIGYISPMHVRQLSIREKLYIQHDFLILPEYMVEGGNNREFAFYKRLHQGKWTLLKRIHKRTQSQYALGLSTVNSSQKPQVITTETYWLSDNQQAYQKVSLRRKSFEKALPEWQKEIRELTKMHQLNLFEEQDVLRLLEFLETS